MDTRILDQLEGCLSQEIDLAGSDLGELEAAVRQKFEVLGRSFLQRLVERANKGYRGSDIACCCGGRMRFIGHRVKEINTLFGWIDVPRAYYHCARCGHSCVPYDQDSGLGGEHISPGLARACCMLAVEDSFIESSRKVKELLGREVSDSTIDRLVRKVGKVVLAEQEDGVEAVVSERRLPEAEAAARRLYVVADGTTARETDGWHEAKVGCVYWDDERFDRHKRYVGSFENSEIFGWHLWYQACACGLRGAEEVIYIGDGAAWVRTEHQRHFPQATFIVDWYHASEHIWDCGKALFGDGTEQTERWVRKRTSLLWDGWTRKLLKNLQRQAKKHRGAKRDSIEALYRYIASNEEQMRYDVFRSKGYEIGSGAAEGACKHVVGKRLKQSGMIWTRPCSSAVLALRLCWLNRQWDGLWLKKPLAA